MSGSILAAISLSLAPKHGVLDPPAPIDTTGHAAFTELDGEPLPLSRFAGRALLVVNTASKCGFRSQFADLEELHREFADRGLVVVGVPSNDFGNQEPHDEKAIAEIYRDGLNLTFPVTSKVRVRGSGMHPFFAEVRAKAGAHAAPKWNFYKYLITRDGDLAAWFATVIRPGARRIREAIDACLG